MASVLQTDAWGQFKEKYGWQPHRIEGVLILSRTLIAGRSLWYAPEVHLADAVAIKRLTTTVHDQAKKDKALCFRLELSIPHTEDLAESLRGVGFVKSFESVQPEWRALVDVRPDEKQILSTMHQKGRYNIRLAQRHSVVVEESRDIETFYKLYTDTGKRDGFTPRGKEYLADFLAQVPGAALFLAKKDDLPLAGAIVIFYDQTANYLYGASSAEQRELMAPHLLHWEIIREAKRRGVLHYDLGEVAPPDAPNHPLKGLTEFKLKFGAAPIHLMGSWDFILEPFWYTVFRVGERIRRGFRAR